MKNKGFTLIELLAVIVILAIIALIATPIILGIINQSRIGAAEASATAIIKAVGDAYGQAVLAANGDLPTLEGVAAKFKMDNAKMNASEKTITTEGLPITCTITTDSQILKASCAVTDGKTFKTDDDANMKLKAGE